MVKELEEHVRFVPASSRRDAISGGSFGKGLVTRPITASCHVGDETTQVERLLYFDHRGKKKTSRGVAIAAKRQYLCRLLCARLRHDATRRSVPPQSLPVNAAVSLVIFWTFVHLVIWKFHMISYFVYVISAQNK